MPFSKKLGECLCERCGHSWKPKSINGKYLEPKSCAGCKSKVWNKPRKYNLGTAESALIVVKREKPTGRASAKAKKSANNGSEFDIFVGDIITTSWGTGPYEVVEVTQDKDKTYNFTLVLPGTKKFKNGTYRESDLFWVSKVTRDGERYPSGNNGEIFVKKPEAAKSANYPVNEHGVFTRHETIIIAKKKRFYFELRLSTKDNLWFVGYHYQLGMSQVGDYAGSCLPGTKDTPYQTREEAITRSLLDFVENYGENYKDVINSTKEFLKDLPEVFLAFEQFKPTLTKLRKERLKSADYDWWKSRWYEFVAYQGNDSYSERISKNNLEKLFPKVWGIYQGELTK